MFSECKCKKCSYCALKDREIKAKQSELNDAYLMLDNRDRRGQGLKRDIVERELYISELVKDIQKLHEDADTLNDENVKLTYELQQRELTVLALHSKSVGLTYELDDKEVYVQALKKTIKRMSDKIMKQYM